MCMMQVSVSFMEEPAGALHVAMGDPDLQLRRGPA